MSKYKIIYLVNSLGNGGSEKQLFYLIRSLHIKFEISIIKTNNNIEYYDHKIKELGIEIYSYDISNSLFSFDSIKKIFKIKSFINDYKPDIIHSWLYRANLINSILFLYFLIKLLIASKFFIIFSFFEE